MKAYKPFLASVLVRRIAVPALIAWSMPLCAADPAQGYPLRPVRIITGSPGSTADITARFIGQKLAERFRQQMVIDNRASAGGIVGAEIVARRPRTAEQVPRALRVDATR